MRAHIPVAVLLLRGVDNSKSQDFRAARAGERLDLTGGVENQVSKWGLGWTWVGAWIIICGRAGLIHKMYSVEII